MTTDTKEAEARARAHSLLEPRKCQPTMRTSHDQHCDRLTAELLSHAAALDELRSDRDVAVSVAWNLRRDLAAAIAERDGLREALRAVALRGCNDDGHLHHPDECPAGDRCGSCPCSAHIADRALKATEEGKPLKRQAVRLNLPWNMTSPTPASKGPTK